MQITLPADLVCPTMEICSISDAIFKMSLVSPDLDASCVLTVPTHVTAPGASAMSLATSTSARDQLRAFRRDRRRGNLYRASQRS